jgi:hypothetical protein
MPINSFLYPSKNVPVPYEVANSCRFNSADSPHLQKTGSTPSSEKTFTFSCWVKKCATGVDEHIFDTFNDSSNRSQISFTSADVMDIRFRVSNSNIGRLVTNRKFRDPSAWLNIVVRVDTTQSTSGDRLRLYINGIEETSFSTETQPSEDADTDVTGTITIGAYNNGGSENNFFQGYLAEVVYCDGQSYAPTEFGEFDSDSPTIWKPKDPSGLTFGTNGFYLDFEDSSNLGNDVNGGTDLTENNIAAADQATDTCTNNFCTMNPLDYTPTTFAEGNLKLNFSQSPNVFGITTGTLFMGSGKYYFEAKITSPDSSTGIQVGVIQVEPYLSRLTAPGVDLSLFFGLGARFITTGGVHKVLNGTDSSISDSWSNDDIIRIAYDGSAGKIYMFNGTSELTGQDFSAGTSFNNGTLTPGTMVLPYTSFGDGGSGTKTAQVEWNFGGCPAFSISSGNSDANGYGNFEYSVPSGYYSLCTKNLAEFG